MNDFPKWTGQVALISGAGSELGIGFAIARRLAREGVRLLITASSERIRQRAEELSACGHDVRAASADLTDEAQVQGLLDWAEAQWGRVDILVNNAGMAQLDSAEPFSAVEATSLRDWQLSLSRNLTSAFLLTRGLLPGMRERGYGRIVNVASTTGTRGSNPGEAAYSAAKAGLVGWSMGLALEVAKSGITVNSVAPAGSPPPRAPPKNARPPWPAPADVPAGPKRWPPRWPSSPRPKPASSTANCWWWMAATA